MEYRREIDGLRAIAVLPVILFHAGFSWFSGGYVGVDVFFVISGYLITSILINDLEKGTFSIAKFYERRARRILPALFFVMLCCIPFSWMWMAPQQFKDFSQAFVAISFFASNILFWRESGYFAPAAEENPLLHTWSLAVEEQFYIFFPIMLLLLWRFGKNPIFYTIMALSAISLLLSEWGWRNSPSANFYLLPTRAWELFAGSIAAFIVKKRGVQPKNFLSLLGFLAIIFAIFFYDESTPFPSMYALVPVSGVLLIILFAEKSTFTANLLSTKILVGIGLVSYSAYLWHQPLFAFARLENVSHPSSFKMLSLSFISIILAVFSWMFIEQPFRKKGKIYSSRKAIFTLSFAGIFLMSAAGYAGHITNGATNIRFTEPQISYLETAKSSPLRPNCHFPQVEESINREECEYFNKKGAEIAVLGNSHATELAYEVAKSLEPLNMTIKHHTMSGCKHNFRVSGEESTVCQRWHNVVLEKLSEDEKIKTVILSYRNDGYLDNEVYRRSLVEISQFLLDANKKVVLVLQAPLPGSHIDQYLFANIDSLPMDVKGMSISSWNHIYGYKDNLMNELPSEVIVLDPVNNFCKENGDCFVIKDGRALYFDDDHMSLYGAEIISESLLDHIIF